jgi:hypothetical protein
VGSLPQASVTVAKAKTQPLELNRREAIMRTALASVHTVRWAGYFAMTPINSSRRLARARA